MYFYRKAYVHCIQYLVLGEWLDSFVAKEIAQHVYLYRIVHGCQIL